jgi:hypothetical protein
VALALQKLLHPQVLNLWQQTNSVKWSEPT